MLIAVWLPIRARLPSLLHRRHPRIPPSPISCTALLGLLEQRRDLHFGLAEDDARARFSRVVWASRDMAP